MKKFFSMMLALMMVLSLSTIAWGEESTGVDCSGGCTDTENHVAAIGMVHYNSLSAALNAAKSMTGEVEVELKAGEYAADLYSGTYACDSLTIIGQGADTKLKFSKTQVLLSKFKNLMISNCTIERMPDKGWGHMVFASSTTPDGVYTISNCFFNGVGTQGIYINQTVPATFKIENCTFNGNFGGEGAITIQNTNDNKNIAFTVNVVGCTFKNIPPSSHMVFAKDVVPENKWSLSVSNSRVSYSFDSNGGSGSMDGGIFSSGADITLPECAFNAPSNKEFKGWATSADGAIIDSTTYTVTVPVTFYAQWGPISYSITYNNVTAVENSNPTTYTVESDTITLAAPAARPGYTFAGWYADETFTGDAVTEIAAGSTGDKSYYAKWTPNTYTVAFDANSGDGTMADLSFTYGTAQNLTANAFTRVGYNFAGWATSADGAVAYANGASVSNLTAENNGTVTLYAVWTKIPPAPVYPSVDTPAFDPDEDVDVEDNTLNDAALAVGDAIENGDVKMEPAAGYTVEEITKLQNEGKLNLVIQKKLSYDTTEKSLIDAAITKVGGSASQVDVVYIDVTPVLMTDDGTVVATITDTEKPLTITLDLSAEMQKAAKEGKFISVIRVHDGKVTFLDSNLNAEKTKITFTSSEFSAYAVVAMDRDPSANTFDAGIAMYSVMALLAATGSAVIIKKRK